MTCYSLRHMPLYRIAARLVPVICILIFLPGCATVTSRPVLFDIALPGTAAAADKLLGLAPYSVTDKKIMPPSGDTHDYVSLSIYYWPDPGKADGKPYVLRDGEVNPERNSEDRYDRIRLGRMAGAVSTLAAAFRETGEERYAAKAARLIRAWFLDPGTLMNPHLEFGQGVPGGAAGKPGGIIDTIDLIEVVRAALALETSASFTGSDRDGLRDWFARYLRWLRESGMGRKEADSANNHGVWYDAQTAAYALYSGDPDLAAAIVRDAKARRVATQIEPDGSMPRELARTRSFHYSVFSLEAFITLASIGDLVGVDLWDFTTPDGRSLEKAIDFVLPHLPDAKAWEYRQIVQEDERAFAVYLGLAEKHYKKGKYAEAIPALSAGT